LLFSTDGLSKICIWNLENLKYELIEGDYKGIDNLEISKNDTFFAFTVRFNTVHIFDFRTRLCIFSICDLDLNLISVSDEGLLIAASSRNNLEVWDFIAKGKIGNMMPHFAKVNCIELFENNGKAITGSNDKSAGIWDLIRKQRIANFGEHEAEVIGVGVTKNSKYFITICANLSLRVWKNCLI
jgi:WD40 repeat protein